MTLEMTPDAQSKKPIGLGLRGWARFCWRQLTSMRTALFLLLLLAIGAIPGSVFPQRSVDPAAVAAYFRQHPDAAPWVDRLGGFAVYASPWFSAIYLLLFISLIGCVVPRLRKHLIALRAEPPLAPSRLTRLPVHREVSLDLTLDRARELAAAALRARRFRVVVRGESGRPVTESGPVIFSAERGYLKETGNLLFHFSLIIVLIGVALGYLLGWRGDMVVPVGDSLTNVAVNYDEFQAGPWVDLTKLPPFSLDLKKLTVRFAEGGSQRGAPRYFRADITKQSQKSGQPTKPETDFIEVNRPLKIDGAQVALLGNGYAPVISVRDSTESLVYSQATVFPPEDGNYRSSGAVQVPGAQPQDIGISAIFLPTIAEGAGGPVSLFPDALDPRLLLTVFVGDLGLGSDSPPATVYELDVSRMRQLVDASGKAFTVALRPGETVDLPDGRGSVSFDRVERFAGLSVRSDPGRLWAFAGAILAMIGLVLSLFVPRRRVFISLRADTQKTVITIAAMARGSEEGLAAEIARIFAVLGAPEIAPAGDRSTTTHSVAEKSALTEGQSKGSGT